MIITINARNNAINNVRNIARDIHTYNEINSRIMNNTTRVVRLNREINASHTSHAMCYATNTHANTRHARSMCRVVRNTINDAFATRVVNSFNVTRIVAMSNTFVAINA